jgi:hypothetical protein
MPSPAAGTVKALRAYLASLTWEPVSGFEPLGEGEVAGVTLSDATRYLQVLGVAE